MNSSQKLWYLSQVHLFRDLSEDALRRIAETSNMKDFEKGTYISTPHDEEREQIYFLKEGEVEVYESSAEGKKIVVDTLGPGDVFGYGNIASEDGGQSEHFIRANRHVILCIMPRHDFLALLEHKPDLALKLIKELSLRLSSTESRLRDAALLDSEARLLQELERIWEKQGDIQEGRRVIGRKYTHEELAHRVGIARETITRTVARLIEKQKIAVDDRGHIILL